MYSFVKDRKQFPPKKTKLVLVDPHYGCEMPTNIMQIKGNVAFVKRGFVFNIYYILIKPNCKF